MKTSRLDQIVRQRNSPELLKAVEHLSKGETVEGIRMLREQGRVTELPDSKERIQAIAKDYVANPEKTIVISPDNKSRQLINQAIRGQLQTSGSLGNDGQEFRSLIHRSDMTGADREWAARYQPGDVLKYTKGSKAYDIYFVQTKFFTRLLDLFEDHWKRERIRDGEATQYVGFSTLKFSRRKRILSGNSDCPFCPYVRGGSGKLNTGEGGGSRLNWPKMA